ncbi:MAG TPA: MazG-like family protein [Candidatus Saccharimonadales bacterium]|nr:MazG-like family protein [Candidatus Saccharimonadales bacterium]
MNKVSIQKLLDAITTFRDERDWMEFTDLKDTAIATSLEAAELLEHFKWKTPEQVQGYVVKHKSEIEDEMMDVIFNVLLMVEQLGTDVDKKFFEKMKKNELKYPVRKVKGVNPHL